MATFLKCSFCIVLFSFFYGKAMPGPRAAGRAAWRVQAFCLRQNLGGGGIHFRRAFISNGVPAGRQPCGAVLPWSTWAMMATFLKCSFCISSISFSSMARPRGAPRRGAHLAADQHTQPPCRLPDSGRRSRFAHSFALYAVLSFFASHSSRVFQKKPPDFAIFMEKRPPKRRCSAVSDNFPGFPEK